MTLTSKKTMTTNIRQSYVCHVQDICSALERQLQEETLFLLRIKIHSIGGPTQKKAHMFAKKRWEDQV